MLRASTRAPEWRRKFDEGKMFRRLECATCRARYHFGESGRASRVPRCPGCGSFESQLAA